MKPLQLVATCARALEPLLADELNALFAQDVVAGDRIVTFSASPEVVYRVLLGTRIANRILWPVCTVEARDGDELYRNLCQHNWTPYLNPERSFCVDFIGESDSIRNSMFGAVRVKDALVDCTRVGNNRATVAKDNPDMRFNAVLLSNDKQTDRVQVAIDLGNGSLHKRGYRTQAGEAPLKETVAAGMLMRAGWPTMAEQGGALFDPFCGSGTILIEAALMAAKIPPGIYREHWGFMHCEWHDEALWQSLWKEGRSRLLNAGNTGMPRIVGSDVLTTVVKKAHANIDRAGLSELITVEAEHLSDSMPPRGKTGLLITNPPYGERLDDDPDLLGLYAKLGEKMSAMHGWQAAVLTSDKLLAQAIGLRSHRSYRFDNGAIACRLYLFTLDERNRYKPVLAVRQDDVCQESSLSDGARMLFNRLKKNQQKLAPWLKQQKVDCYRLYDADMPEYAFAIDVYRDLDAHQVHVHLQEYAPPKTVDENAATRRREETQIAVSAALAIPLQRVHLKRRERQKGEGQYKKQQENQKQDAEDQRFKAQEHGNVFWVNMETYLDTGLFLDTRPVRQLLAKKVRGKRFLNLFSYTASATVYAAKAGAASSLSIDMSATYTDWARHNFAANAVDTRKHRLLTEDCLHWLENATEQFDLIYLDPPTFSNSKRMQNTLDVQRDQVNLIGYALDLLSEEGELIFVTNHQRFKLQYDIFAEHGWHAEDITAQTLDPDFRNSHKIHQCWLFRRNAE